MTGRRVLAGLRNLGVATRAASRSSEWRFDWQDRSTWDRVLDGAGSVYLVQYDPEPLTEAFVERAVAHGVERIVLLSARGADRPGYFEGVDEPVTHLLSEEAVRTSGLEWTILRPGWFAQNFDEGVLADGVREGVLRLPTGEGAVAWIDAEDIAAVAVAALTEEGHHGRAYELSGPRALTLTEATAEISTASGRPVRYEAVSVQDYVTERLAAGWSRGDALLMTSSLSAIAKGREERPFPGVREALGREPRGFAEFVEEAVAAGSWVR
ncbi:hypothetical protein BQ8420_20585 [Nocardiopsis sp. JB363]|nr:hypothetical protein BQ8420_20585 [Nocardiopsis sp. JB363]